MASPDDYRQLTEMAKKARALMRATTDPVTLDVLENYAAECEAQAERLKTGASGSH